MRADKAKKFASKRGKAATHQMPDGTMMSGAAHQGDSDFREKLAAYNRSVFMNQMSKRLDEIPYNPVTDGPRRPLRKYEAMQDFEKILPKDDTAIHTLFAGKYIQRGLAEAYANPSAYTPYAKPLSFIQQLFKGSSYPNMPKRDLSFTSEGLRNLGKAARREDNRMQAMWGDVPSPPTIPRNVLYPPNKKKRKLYSPVRDPSVEQVPR